MTRSLTNNVKYIAYVVFQHQFLKMASCISLQHLGDDLFGSSTCFGNLRHALQVYCSSSHVCLHPSIANLRELANHANERNTMHPLGCAVTQGIAGKLAHLNVSFFRQGDVATSKLFTAATRCQ